MSRQLRKKESQFNAERLEMSEENFRLELLYSQHIQINKLERIRTNLSMIVWIIAIQIIIAVLIVFNGLSALT